MARYVKDMVLNQPDDFVQFIMNDFLGKNGFVLSQWKDEQAFRAGDGVVEGYKYLKWTYFNGMFHLEAWLKGTAGKEMGLDGAWGLLMKKPYKESLEQLFTVLQQKIQPQMQPAEEGKGPVYVQTTDNRKAAVRALVLGILSIVFCIIPILAVILGILALSSARMGIGSSRAGMAKAARVLGIAGIVLGILLWVLNFLMFFS